LEITPSVTVHTFSVLSAIWVAAGIMVPLAEATVGCSMARWSLATPCVVVVLLEAAELVSPVSAESPGPPQP
jgi:hypothetical protein